MDELGQLDFIENLMGSRLQQYRKAPSLKSRFRENVWQFEFGGTAPKMSIDFNITLQDGQLLTNDTKTALLNTIKYWLLAVLHPDSSNRKSMENSPGTLYYRISTLCQIIDYFFIRDSDFFIAQLGFSALSENNVRQLINEISSSNKMFDPIYNYSNKLSAFLIFKVANSDIEELKEIIEACEYDLEYISQEQVDGNVLTVPMSQVPLMRAWLFKEGFYRKGSTRDIYSQRASTSLLSKVLFKNTLRGIAIRNIHFQLLSIGKSENCEKEYPAIPVTDRNEKRVSRNKLTQFKSVLKSIRLLHSPEFSDEKLQVPSISVLDEIEKTQVELVESKRFKTLPSSVVFKAIRDGIKFHLKYGEALFDSYENILQRISEVGIDDEGVGLLSKADFYNALSPKIQLLGVKYWQLNKDKMADKSNYTYYTALRANKGLSNIIQVYVGATAVVVGSIMARRAGELTGLVSGNCLDSTKRYLVFEKKKSTRGLFGFNETISRPIDEIAVDMIEQVERIQAALLKYGYIESNTSLFTSVTTSPIRLGMTGRTGHYACIDFFCDYFETLVVDGARFYIKHHQLRRFFVLTFFWGSGFGSLDTLRWFIGHTDPEHLYHYITESIDGDVLKGVKIQYAAESLGDHESLKELIKDRYATEDFMMLETKEIERYIEDLIDDGDVKIEPEFFEVDGEKRYKVVVKVKCHEKN